MLGVGPEVSNNMGESMPCKDRRIRFHLMIHASEVPLLTRTILLAEAPHNCVGGSEQQCLPGAAEAGIMFADPSKMYNAGGVPAPAHWYKAPVAFM